MIQRFIEAWTHSRFERTGVDELLMGIAPVILLFVVAILVTTFRLGWRRYRWLKTRNTPLCSGQAWSDGEVLYYLRRTTDRGLWQVQQSNAFAFESYCMEREFREKIMHDHLYL